MLINLNDILTLDNNERYIVMAGIVYEKCKYYYLLQLDENDNIANYRAKIMKEPQNNINLKLIDITDMEEEKTVRNLLNESFSKIYSEFLQ